MQLMWMRWPAVAVLAFVALHSLSYGSGFIANPTSGAGEFGDNTPSTEAAENLAGLVGVILLLVASIALTAAVLLVRRNVGGAWLTARGNTWDAGFYSAVGIVLAVMGSLIVWRQVSLGTT